MAPHPDAIVYVDSKGNERHGFAMQKVKDRMAAEGFRPKPKSSSRPKKADAADEPKE